jgi:hypothetical protein
MFYQQGDVIIEPSKIPQNAKQKKGKRVVLAEGETTGHAHVITDTSSCQAFETNDELYIRVTKEITVKHEEHKPIAIAPGEYKVRKVREYDHFLEEARSVQTDSAT